MNQITDNDLTLLYYGEHDDPQLARTVAESENLSARYDALCSELQLADAYIPPERDEDYGVEVWQKISPRLSEKQPATMVRLKSWLVSLTEPRFSLAGAFSFVLIVALAFMLGRNGGQEIVNTPGETLDGSAITLAGIDSKRLLNQSVSGHLEQVNLVLTQFVNSEEAGMNETAYVTDMLVANRLYRQAASTRGQHKLAAFLADLEPLLIELAYGAQSDSPATRARMQQEVRDGLLFRVRIMNKQVNKPEISV